MNTSLSTETKLDLPLVTRGKIRELYDFSSSTLLLVASDRISTYDAVHPTLIPYKGAVLTGISVFWFQKLADIVPNQFIDSCKNVPLSVSGRALIVRKLKMLPLECVVRGYLAGSAWTDYQKSQSVAGIDLPRGLQEAEKLSTPIFTPSTKALEGHDETVSLEAAAKILGDQELLQQLQTVSIKLYQAAADYLWQRGLILADTKFEFGLDENGQLTLADEVLTPDSSRYWPRAGYEPGHSQPSFDKQYVRDWAGKTGWDKQPPAPAIPEQIVRGTVQRYQEAYEKICGKPFQSWLAEHDIHVKSSRS